MKYEKGDYRVLRTCCTSGNCFECRTVPTKDRPVYIEQGRGYSKPYADQVAANWSRYHAKVEHQ